MASSNSPGAAVVIPFEPTSKDVVLSSSEPENHHLGNVFFHHLLQSLRNMPNLQSTASRVVDAVCDERQGRFLNVLPNTTEQEVRLCTVLTRDEATARVYQALQQSQIVSGRTPPTKRARVQRKGEATNLPVSPTSTTTKRGPDEISLKVRCRFRRNVYRIVNGNNPASRIHPYAIELLEAVCNQAFSNVIQHAFQQVGLRYTNGGEEEPEEHRIMRLQMRQRFVAALEANIPTLDFAKTLVRSWDGELICRPEAETIPSKALDVETDVQTVTSENPPTFSKSESCNDLLQAREEEVTKTSTSSRASKIKAPKNVSSISMENPTIAANQVGTLQNSVSQHPQQHATKSAKSLPIPRNASSAQCLISPLTDGPLKLSPLTSRTKPAASSFLSSLVTSPIRKSSSTPSKMMFKRESFDDLDENDVMQGLDFLDDTHHDLGDGFLLHDALAADLGSPEPLHFEGNHVGSTTPPLPISPLATLDPNTTEERTGKWTIVEKRAFLRGLERYGAGRWKQICDMIPTR
jgi:hypothetical protein